RSTASAHDAVSRNSPMTTSATWTPGTRSTKLTREERRARSSTPIGDTLHIDVLLDCFGAAWDDVRDAALAAADAGFDAIWVFDHVDGRVYDAPYVLEAWTVLSALAVVVPDVMLGPMVLNVANRPPGILAAMVATLQHVSGGRVLLGLGAGARPG